MTETERKKSKWVKEIIKYNEVWSCPKCKFIKPHNSYDNFCGHCGEDMRVGETK